MDPQKPVVPTETAPKTCLEEINEVLKKHNKRLIVEHSLVAVDIPQGPKLREETPKPVDNPPVADKPAEPVAGQA